MNLQTWMHSWGFDLEKCLLPIGQCGTLMFNDLLYTHVDGMLLDDTDHLVSLNFNGHFISLYDTTAGTLIVTIQEENEAGHLYCSSVYTISKKMNGDYFILVNHKNRNKIENEYVETFTWSDTKGNLKEIIT